MNRRYAALALLAFIFLASTASTAYATTTANPCYDFFESGGLNSVLRSTSTYYGLIGISMLAIFFTLVIVAIIYVFGFAFGIQKAKQFAKTEVLEALLSFIIIIFVAGGISGIDSAFSYIVGIIGTVAESTAAVPGIGITASTPSAIFYNTCNLYYQDALSKVGDLLLVAADTIIFNTLSSLSIKLMPNGFGFSFSPLAGFTPLSQALSTIGGIFGGIAALELGVGFLLAIIYYLFPLFLFIGVAFRTFPWTRALGGTFIALFISFYIFFPALLYAFTSSVSSSTSPLNLSLPQSISSESEILGILSLDILSVVLAWFANSIAWAAVQIIGIIISFIIALDMVEAFGDLLGAPSLTSRKMLSKII